jgi:hypothetical protein
MAKILSDDKRFGHKDYRQKGMFQDAIENQRRDMPRRVKEYKDTPGFPAEGTLKARKLKKQGKPVVAL